MELMLDFVKGCVYRSSGRYILSRGSGYLICNARTNWMVKYYKLNDPGPHKVGIRAILTVETPSLVVFRMF